MTALRLPRLIPASVAPPRQPLVDMYTRELGEVEKAADGARCHHSSMCLSPLRVGELVIPIGSFFALLDHIERDERSVHVIHLTAGGVPKRL